MTSVLRQSLTGFRQGDHICVLYDSPQECTDVAASFLADGVRRGERSVYSADSAAALESLRRALAALGIDVPYEEARRSLVLVTKEVGHLAGGRFDGMRMLKVMNGAVETALEDGYIGLRVCGDMSWLLDGAPGSAQVVEYEALCTEFFRNVRALGMCQYDRRRLAAALLHGALATHPSIFMDGRHRANPYHQPAALTGDASAASFNSKYSQLKLASAT